jgi:NAD(P)-dependent dehydrogenase (short-subunit alcohol dehydrogenase family)
MQKLIVVTGANRGIGHEICRQLAQKGQQVILTARHETEGKKAVSDLKGEGLQVVFHPLDITVSDSVQTFVDWLTTNYGKLDVLVNNAGIFSTTGIADAPLSEIQSILNTNLVGIIHLTQQLLPLLHKSNEGRIINISSGMGTIEGVKEGGFGGYRLSKAGLNMITMMFAKELAPTKLKINAMCPGWVKTDMGGSAAPRSVTQGADTAMWLATAKEIPTGCFFRDRQIISW